MTAYELLATHKTAIEYLSAASVDIQDVKYVEMYREYARLNGEGHKSTYIAYYLSEKYDINRSTFYRVIKRLAQRIDI